MTPRVTNRQATLAGRPCALAADAMQPGQTPSAHAADALRDPVAAYRLLAGMLQRQARAGDTHTDTPHVDVRSPTTKGAPMVLPHWADASAIVSLTLALGDGRRSGLSPRLDVALADGIPGTALPPRWALPCGASITLRAVRAPRLRAQSLGAPGVRRTQAPLLSGTATALVRDRLAVDRLYLLTCGHVVAPDATTRTDELIDVLLDDGNSSRRTLGGRLAEWLPAMGHQALRTGIDAALVEVLRSDAVALARQGALLANGVGGAARLDARVSLRRQSAPLAGTLKIHWSGWVDLPAITPGVADYFLQDAVGYASTAATQPGDSGAALWDADERLMGMHLGAIPDAAAGAANAVLAPIGPVLDWFQILPWLRDDPATLPARPLAAGRVAPPVLPPSARAPDEALLIIAKTLWAEAAGEGQIGMEAVGGVIANRTRLKWRHKTDEVAVCLDYKQFSCWNTGSPLLAKMERVQRQPDAAWRDALDIARRVLAGSLSDCTDGATHYFASTLRRRPSWERGAVHCRTIGSHLFFKGIR